MSHFIKFNSIDNHYQTKSLMRWLSEFPELQDETFILEEKVDGANVQIYITPDGNVQIGKRSAFLKEDENFFNLHEIIQQPLYQDIIENVKSTAKVLGYPIRLYGELFGPGIQNRINYDVETPQIIFFDFMLGELFASPKIYHGMYKYTLNLNLPVVPKIGLIKGLNSALDINREFKSHLSKTDNAEGFIIKPYDKTYISKNGSRFLLKAKSDSFAEKMKVKVKERKETPKRVMEAYTKFMGYVTDNRLDNVIGNFGPFTEPKQIGDYIRYMLDDMKKDFKADGFIEENFEPDELKQIYNVGHKIVELLKGRL